MTKSRDAFRTISEVADWLGTQAHVLRFWESKFSQVKPDKRAGGRRYYRPSDMALLGGIKTLLHDNGMTIKGVQKVLREEGVKHVASMSPPLDRDIEEAIEAHADETAGVADVVAPADTQEVSTAGSEPLSAESDPATKEAADARESEPPEPEDTAAADLAEPSAPVQEPEAAGAPDAAADAAPAEPEAVVADTMDEPAVASGADPEPEPDSTSPDPEPEPQVAAASEPPPEPAPQPLGTELPQTDMNLSDVKENPSVVRAISVKAKALDEAQMTDVRALAARLAALRDQLAQEAAR